MSRRSVGAVAGIGLFAECVISRGTLLGAFTGEVLTRDEVVRRRADRRAARATLVQVTPSVFLDPTRGNVSCWRWLNSSAGTGKAANVEWVADGVRVLVCARADIAPGQELLADYDWTALDAHSG